MKKLFFPIVLFLFLSTAVFGQSQRNDYKKIDYIMVSSKYTGQFVQLVKRDLTTRMNALVRSGDLKYWNLYRVEYPGGEKSGYNFVSVATANSMDTFEQLYSKPALPKYLPDGMGSDSKRISNISTLVKSEIWKVENNINSDTLAKPSRFVAMDYMKVAPGKSPDYLMLEDEIAKPIHIERIQENRMDDWEVYSLILPGGVNYGYNFATGNHFEKISQVEFGFNSEVIKRAMGENSNIPELFNTIYSTRDLVKRELWELVDHVQ